jgi:hypothetical protein
VLAHCFAGCSAADVVAAAGLEIADLFARRPTADMSLAERAALREHSRQAKWRAALNVLGLETRVVLIASRRLKLWRTLSDEDEARLKAAVERIEAAQGVLCESR